MTLVLDDLGARKTGALPFKKGGTGHRAMPCGRCALEVRLGWTGEFAGLGESERVLRFVLLRR